MRPQSRSLTWPQSELEFPARPGLRGHGPCRPFDGRYRRSVADRAVVAMFFDPHPGRAVDAGEGHLVIARTSRPARGAILLRHPRPELYDVAIDGECAVAVVMDGLGGSLCRISPGDEHLQHEDVE